MECNTELCLSPYQYSNKAEEEIKPLTILYGGQICTCDATEIQARAIISKAKQDMEMKCKNHENDEIKNGNKNKNENEKEKSFISLRTNSGLSMKKSLQRFLLQRRITKTRNSKDNNSSN